MNVRIYSSPLAFKQAIEDRLRSKLKTGGELARPRQLVHEPPRISTCDCWARQTTHLPSFKTPDVATLAIS